MLLPKLTGNIWTHKTVVDYTQLLNAQANFSQQANVVGVTNLSGTNYYTIAPNNSWSVGAGTFIVQFTPTAVSSTTLTIGSSIYFTVPGSNADNFFTGSTITVMTGAGVGETAVIIGYNGTTRVLTLNKTLATLPTTSDNINIYGGVNQVGFLNGVGVQVKSGTDIGQDGIIATSSSPDANGNVTVTFSPDFSPVLDTTSVLTFAQYYPWKDVLLFGIPANHVIIGTKIVTLSSFNAGNLGGTPNSVFVFIGDSGVFPANPSSTETVLVTNLNSTYGMSNLTIPTGAGDSYEYGSFRWFTISGPGTATYPYGRTSNQLGSPATTYGSYCVPTRLDARDITARFCILDYQDWQYTSPGNDFAQYNQAKFESEWNFNANVVSGTVEITVQYMSL
jgi:hypothetical protein